VSLHAWFTPLVGPGEECIDLATCRRFVCWEAGEDEWVTLHYYEAPGPRWIQYSVWSDGGEDLESYREVHGQEVAFELLRVPKFGGRLTPQLEPFRQYGDPETYRAWMSEYSEESGDRPRWDAAAGTFSIGDAPFRRVATQATNQRLILDALERAGWPPGAVSVDIDDRDRLREAIKEMNEWLTPTPFLIRRDQMAVRWLRKGSPNSPKSR
jgi:hypothetical protein